MADFAAGWMGGCAGIVVGQPFDTIKVRQQASLRAQSLTKVALECLNQDGKRGLFRGMLYPLLSAGAVNSLFFGSYSVALNKLTNSSSAPSLPMVFAAGMAGGVTQLLLACPVEVAKIRLQTQSMAGNTKILSKNVIKMSNNTVQPFFRGPGCVLRYMYERRGIRGLYMGLPIMCIRDIPAWGLYMASYASLTNISPSPSAWTQFWSGGIAGVLSWLSIIPLDVAKSRLQADCIDKPRYRGMMDVFAEMFTEAKENRTSQGRVGGIGVLCRGLPAVLMRAFLVNGATFVVYEACLLELKNLGH